MSFPLDHIIHLSTPGELPKTIEQFKELGFEVTPGGKHADGLTENALIVLADGVYIELIQFTKLPSEYPSDSVERYKRQTHWWASMKEGGWIDYSLGDLMGAGDVSVADAINTRALDSNVNVIYDDGIEGGRIKPDGEAIRWLVTFPNSETHLRGSVPFFCKDLTPRSRRVPSLPTAAAGRANSSRVGALTLMCEWDKFNTHSVAISTVLGCAPQSRGHESESGDDGAVWMLDSPTTPASIKLELISANTDEEKEWVYAVGGIGVRMITLALAVANDRHQGSGGQASGAATGGGIGAIRWTDSGC